MARVSGNTAKTSPRTEKPKRNAARDLALSELVSLALVDEGVNHGWAIGTLLAHDGDLGRVWTLSRSLTYRAIEQLSTKALVRRGGQESGRGRERTILTCSASGRRIARQWLEEPVEHMRDVRTELLLKLLLRRRRGLALEPVLEAQQSVFAVHFNSLTVPGRGADPVDLWRRESARAVRRFLDAALDQPAGTDPIEEPSVMRISARNQLRARVTAVTHGEVMSSIKTVLPDGQTLTAVITKESAEELDIAPDDDVLVIIKSTEVMLAKP